MSEKADVKADAVDVIHKRGWLFTSLGFTGRPIVDKGLIVGGLGLEGYHLLDIRDPVP